MTPPRLPSILSRCSADKLFNVRIASGRSVAERARPGKDAPRSPVTRQNPIRVSKRKVGAAGQPGMTLPRSILSQESR